MTLNGAAVKLPDAGHVTVVDVWQTSCVPCVEMMPALEELWQRERNAGVRVVGVAVDDNPGLVQEKLRERGVTYPNVVDAGGQVQQWLRVGGRVPLTVVFDVKGRVRWVHSGGGPGDVDVVGRAVTALLHEGGGP